MEQEIRQLLGETAVMGRNILYFEELGSTNTYAKELALTDAPEGTVVIADCQTAGRGRMDRSFQTLPHGAFAAAAAAGAVGAGDSVGGHGRVRRRGACLRCAAWAEMAQRPGPER